MLRQGQVFFADGRYMVADDCIWYEVKKWLDTTLCVPFTIKMTKYK